MWLYRTSGDAKTPIVLYDYQPDRKKIRPAVFLKGFKGYLHTDGYEGYHSLPKEINIVGCWAHMRRKFDEALKVMPEKVRDSSRVWQGKRYCDRLFYLKRDFAALSAEERYTQRLKQSKPVMDEFFAWSQSLQNLVELPPHMRPAADDVNLTWQVMITLVPVGVQISGFSARMVRIKN